MAEDKTKLHCSFCGKEQAKVKKLIAGPNIYICNECVDLCNDILKEEDKNEKDQIWDSRSEKQYIGIDKQGNKRGGHVVGSKNLEWMKCVDLKDSKRKSWQ